MINIHIISGVKISKFSNTQIVDSKCENEFIDTSEISLFGMESDWLFELIWQVSSLKDRRLFVTIYL